MRIARVLGMTQFLPGSTAEMGGGPARDAGRIRPCVGGMRHRGQTFGCPRTFRRSAQRRLGPHARVPQGTGRRPRRRYRRGMKPLRHCATGRSEKFVPPVCRCWPSTARLACSSHDPTPEPCVESLRVKKVGTYFVHPRFCDLTEKNVRLYTELMHTNGL
jgi:hypothetical protein